MASPLAANAIDHIADIPGLYISEYVLQSQPIHPAFTLPRQIDTSVHRRNKQTDNETRELLSITALRDRDLLRRHGITHVLSLTDAGDDAVGNGNGKGPPDIPVSPAAGAVVVNHVAVPVGDNPLEDLMPCLEALCAWIRNALGGPVSAPLPSSSRQVPDTNTATTNTTATTGAEPRILLHCTQGISRSGAIATAYAMRALDLDYDAALARVRAARPAVAPNPGFADQLRLWRELGWSIYDVPPTATTAGKETNEVALKPGYEAWRDGRGVLLSRAQQERREALMRRMRGLTAKYAPDWASGGGLSGV